MYADSLKTFEYLIVEYQLSCYCFGESVEVSWSGFVFCRVNLICVVASVLAGELAHKLELAELPFVIIAKRG